MVDIFVFRDNNEAFAEKILYNMIKIVNSHVNHV